MGADLLNSVEPIRGFSDDLPTTGVMQRGSDVAAPQIAIVDDENPGGHWERSPDWTT